ncbi:enoyl-CoA hydratase-related protein [Streptomyces fuscichromogenes]|uniref:enoyl-CoA hydratase-related protein n=1 Tax=Streptomyces fuscichromogenes TaxID=1324013 RepID=UPI0037F2AC86
MPDPTSVSAPVDKVDKDTAEKLATDLYRALAEGDRERLVQLLHPGFEGRATEGLPLGLGGTYTGPDVMMRRFWGRIAKSFDARAQPTGFGLLDDGRLLVTGRYRGHARAGAGVLDAEFVHLLSFTGSQVSGLVQLTDSDRWYRALESDPPSPALKRTEYHVEDGLGILRLNRPEQRNALDQTFADELYEVAQRCAADTGLRALLLLGSGPAFTVGGDITAFARSAPGALPGDLRRMIVPFHDALRILSGLDAPIVAGVHGAAAGGGLGLLHVADIVIAAEGTRFATGFAGIGLSGDGGNSWFLPRLVGMRRAAELYLEQRVLDADEAADWGLVNRVVPRDALDAAATDTARRLAQGPTRAFGEIRRLLRDSWTATLPDQLSAEIDAIARTAASDDATEAVKSFLAKTAPTFQGR